MKNRATRDTNKGYKQGGITLSQSEILKACSNFLTIKDIKEYRKVNRSSVYKVIKILLKKGLIFRKERGIYELTEAGKRGLHSLIGLSYKLRQHNLAIKIKVLESPKNWDKKRSQIITMPCFNKRVQLKNNTYDLLNLGKIQLKITSQSIIFRLPTILATTIDEAVLQAMGLLYETIPKVESQFKIKLIKDYKANITIISQEYARLNDSLARLYKEEDNKLYVTDDEGKVWLIADYSLSVNELETISPDRADEDMRIVHAFLNDLRKFPITLSEMRKEKIQSDEILRGLSSNFVKLSLSVYEITNILKDRFKDRNT